MPFKRINKCVYKVTKNGKKKEKQGCSDSISMAKKYLKALYANADDVSEDVSDYLNQFSLTEARFKDVKAKYSQYKDLVDAARDYIKEKIGDKGVSKYILYIMRETHQMLGEPETFEEVLEAGPERSEVKTLMFDLIDTVEKFEKNTGRIKEKDIYKLNAAQLEKIIDDLPKSRSEKGKKEKEQAIEGSEIVYEDDDMFAVRPYTTNASCYYGKNTRWCISATQAYNYFDEYTSKGRGFVMVRMENLEEDNPNKKIAIVYDDGGEFEEAYDAPDDQMGYVELRDAVAQNYAARPGGLKAKMGIRSTSYFDFGVLPDEDQEKVQNILDKLINAGSENVMDNPPEGENIEEKIDELEATYEGRIDNAYYSSEYDAAGDQRVYFDGGFYIEISDEELTGEYPDDSEWRTLTAAGDKIRSALDQELSVYTTNVELDSSSEGVAVRIEINQYDYEPTVAGYETFLDELESYDKKYKSIIRVVKMEFLKRGWIKETEYDSFAAGIQSLNSKFTNFKITQDEDIGDEEISFKTERLPIQKSLSRFQLMDQLNFIRKGLPNHYFNESLNNRVHDRLKTLNQKIVAALKSQLPLPGIPQQKIKELTIPEMLEVKIMRESSINPMDDKPCFFNLEIIIDDFDITRESLNTIVSVVKFIDQNYREIVKIVSNAINVFIASGLAGAELAKIDAEDGTDPVNEDIDAYFSNLTKSTLQRRIDKMTIKEWLDPECPAPWDEDFKNYHTDK